MREISGESGNTKIRSQPREMYRPRAPRR